MSTPSFPQNQSHTRLNILQWISFVLRIRKRTLITAYSPLHSLPASPSLSSPLTFLHALKEAKFPPTHTQILVLEAQQLTLFYPVNATYSSDINLIIFSLGNLSFTSTFAHFSLVLYSHKHWVPSFMPLFTVGSFTFIVCNNFDQCFPSFKHESRDCISFLLDLVSHHQIQCLGYDRGSRNTSFFHLRQEFVIKLYQVWFGLVLSAQQSDSQFPCPLQLRSRVLTTGPPASSLL